MPITRQGRPGQPDPCSAQRSPLSVLWMGHLPPGPHLLSPVFPAGGLASPLQGRGLVSMDLAGLTCPLAPSPCPAVLKYISPSYFPRHPGAPAGWAPSPAGRTVSASCQVLPLPVPPPEATNFDSWVELSPPIPFLRVAQISIPERRLLGPLLSFRWLCISPPPPISPAPTPPSLSRGCPQTCPVLFASALCSCSLRSRGPSAIPSRGSGHLSPLLLFVRRGPDTQREQEKLFSTLVCFPSWLLHIPLSH